MNRESKYCMGQFFLCGKIADYVNHSLRLDAAKRDAAEPARPSLVGQVVGAVLGGICCTVVSHPDDVVKTKMQTHLRGSPYFGTYHTFVGTLTHVYKTEGVAALFSGAAFRCLLRVPLGLSVIIVSGTWMRELAAAS